MSRSSWLAPTTWQSLAVAAGAVAIAACGGTQPHPRSSESPPHAAKLTCSDSIYTASIRPGASPKAFNAIEIGPAIFNDLRSARDPSQLAQEGSLLVEKSPLTIVATGEVTITVSSLHSGRIVMLYGRDVPDLLSRGAPQVAEFPDESRFRLCGYAGSALRAPQFAGGFGVSRPGCYRIRVSIGRRSTSRVVSFATGSACPNLA